MGWDDRPEMGRGRGLVLGRFCREVEPDRARGAGGGRAGGSRSAVVRDNIDNTPRKGDTDDINRVVSCNTSHTIGTHSSSHGMGFT